MDLTADDFRWLISSSARPYLERAALDSASVLDQTRRLRRELSVARTHLVLEQVALRRRAREKFSRADEMFFTRQNLEQATEERIAVYKASRVPAEQRVFDLACGIGGDLLGWGRRSQCTAIDRNPIAVLLAQANGATYGLCDVRYSIEDVTDCAIQECDFWHLDPDRRPAGLRVTSWNELQPGPDVIRSLLDHQPEAAIKLAPATQLPAEWSEIAEREWIGSRRECRQQVAWFGRSARIPGSRRATVITPDGHAHAIAGMPETLVPTVSAARRFVFDPHAAVDAARLTGALCEQFALSAVETVQGYLTAGEPSRHPLLATFEVVDVLPYDVKKLRQWLRERGIGRLEVKTRGVDVNPSKLLAALKLSGDARGTLLIMQGRGGVRAILAQRPLSLD